MLVKRSEGLHCSGLQGSEGTGGVQGAEVAGRMQLSRERVWLRWAESPSLVSGVALCRGPVGLRTLCL